jgi:hypothetical protein
MPVRCEAALSQDLQLSLLGSFFVPLLSGEKFMSTRSWFKTPIAEAVCL